MFDKTKQSKPHSLNQSTWNHWNAARSAGLRIIWLYPRQKGKTPPKRGVMRLTLNWIWWWSSKSWRLENVKFSFIVITPRSTLTWIGCTSKVPINGLNRSVLKLSIFDKRYLMHYNCKLFVLRILTWRYNCWLRISYCLLRPPPQQVSWIWH